jgi:type IV pilus assembly protein PilW
MSARPDPSRHAGTTLIELMVALTIGMVLSLAVFGVLTSFEGSKRTINAGNDLEQAGQLAMYKLDTWARSAGSGLGQVDVAYGCPVYAAKSGAALLPLPAGGLQGPGLNASLPGSLGLAPLLIVAAATTPATSGQPSDGLVVMGAATVSGVPATFADLPTGDALSVASATDFSANDLVLVGDKQAADDGRLRPCLVQQVAGTFAGGNATAVPLAGPYQVRSMGDVSLATYSRSGFAVRLGNATSARPRLQFVAVGDDDVLYSDDLLALDDSPLKAEAEGAFELHALYGVDTDGDGKADTWVAPTGDYSAQALSAGTPDASARLRQIKAVRIGLLTRTSLPERDEVTAGPLTLFNDLPALRYSRSLSSDERHYRYGAVEETVPLRNNLLLP